MILIVDVYESSIIPQNYGILDASPYFRKVNLPKLFLIIGFILTFIALFFFLNFVINKPFY